MAVNTARRISMYRCIWQYAGHISLHLGANMPVICIGGNMPVICIGANMPVICIGGNMPDQKMFVWDYCHLSWAGYSNNLLTFLLEYAEYLACYCSTQYAGAYWDYSAKYLNKYLNEMHISTQYLNKYSNEMHISTQYLNKYLDEIHISTQYLNNCCSTLDIAALCSKWLFFVEENKTNSFQLSRKNTWFSIVCSTGIVFSPCDS